MNTLVRLGDIISLHYGKSLPKNRRINGENPVFGSGGYVGTHKTAAVKGPGIIVGRTGTIGSVYWSHTDFFPIDTTFYVEVKQPSMPLRFAFYLLKSLPLDKMNTNVAVPGLNRNNAYQMEINLPQEKHQAKIAEMLSAYDNLIANNQRRIVLLEKAVHLLYREWFVKKRTSITSHTQCTKLRLADVSQNFDKERVPLSTMERDACQGIYPYYGAASVLDHINDFIFNGRFLLVGEDGTVMTKSGTPVLQLAEGKFWVNNHAHVLQGVSVSTEFLYCALSNYKISGHITGVAQPKITQKNLNRIEIAFFSDDGLMKKFDNLIQPIIDQKLLLKKHNITLAKARDLLLPRLMDGRIKL